jgi:hypothetical protein
MNRGSENVMHAGVMPLPRYLATLDVERVGVFCRKLANRRNTKELEISEGGLAYVHKARKRVTFSM